MLKTQITNFQYAIMTKRAYHSIEVGTCMQVKYQWSKQIIEFILCKGISQINQNMLQVK